MIKMFMFALCIAVSLSIGAFAWLSPAYDVLESQLYESPVSLVGNAVPECAEMTLETQKGIAVFKSFFAADPDGDEISFEIVKYPRNGSVTCLADGQFVYLPLSGFGGRDSFSYRAVDAYGNTSGEKTVRIKVLKPACDVYFDDMKNHWAHNSAIKMASTGLMTGTSGANGEYLFRPEENMTRGDFLALSLIMAGYENDIPFASETVFADDSTIPKNIKSYVQYAYDKGIVSGYDNGDGSINFESSVPISRGEAAVITERILNLASSSDAVPSYKDADDIPVWASTAVCSLSAAGIISGNSSGDFAAERCLTRAEGAEMICNVSSYVKEIQGSKKERTFFNLFGLLG